MKTILVTGGAGYIGSHACVELLNAGYCIVVLDNLSNSSSESLARVQKITHQTFTFVEGDIRDQHLVLEILIKYQVDAVMHFAGLKSVGESCLIPLDYYDNNVHGTLVLCEQMKKAKVKRLVFSSSATVYGDPKSLPINENFPLSATNPYGRSKLIIEEILQDLWASDHEWSIGLLRYFNPVGAHSSGLIGEDPHGIPNNLMPYVSQVAIGKLKNLNVFGGDYPTKDGTGIRDYIHVVDLVLGHIKALDYLTLNSGVHVWNLGVGKGYSVLDLVQTFERVTNKAIPYLITERRQGDVAACYADVDKALAELNWQAEFNLEVMISDEWAWQKNNPNGYKKIQ